MIKLDGKISQAFGANATPTYVAGGLKGHSGIDIDAGYGSLIHSYWDEEYVYKVLTVENPANDGSGFTGVFTIVEQDGKVFEFLYGHCNPTVKVGSILTRGSVLGTQSNNGECYSNGIRITLEMQKNGDHRGTHRHDQARELRKDTSLQPNTDYITDRNGYANYNGFYYAIPNFNNGYRGCFDWLKWQEELNKVPAVKAIPPQKDTPFIAMQKAILAFQLSEGINDFKNAPLKDIIYGDKTKKATLKYK